MMSWAPQQEHRGRVLGECHDTESHDLPVLDPSSMSQAEVTEFLGKAVQTILSACKRLPTISCTSTRPSQPTCHRYGDIVWEADNVTEEHTGNDQAQNLLALTNQSTNSALIACPTTLQLRETLEMSDTSSKKSGQSVPPRDPHEEAMRYGSAANDRAFWDGYWKSGDDTPDVFEYSRVESKSTALLGNVIGNKESKRGNIYRYTTVKGSAAILGNVTKEAAPIIFRDSPEIYTGKPTPAQPMPHPQDMMRGPGPFDGRHPGTFAPQMSYAQPAQNMPMYPPYQMPRPDQVQFMSGYHNPPPQIEQYGSMPQHGPYHFIMTPQGPYHFVPHMGYQRSQWEHTIYQPRN